MSVVPTHDSVPQLARSGRMIPPQRGGPGQAAAVGLTGRDVMRIVLKRKWLIILSVAIATGIAIGATILWLIYKPFYTAEAYLQVNPPKASELVERPQLPTKQVMDRLTRSYAQLIKTDAVLSKATEEPALNRTEWYRRRSGSDVVQELYDAIGVAPVPDTMFIRVWMTEPAGSDKERGELADIVNAVCNTFVEDNTKATQQDRIEKLNRLREERRQLQNDLDSIRREMTENRPQDIPNIEDQRNVLSVQLQTLAQQRIELDMQLAEQEAALQQLEQQEAAGTLASSPMVRSIIESDPTLQSLRNAEVNLATELDDATRKFGARHRTVRTLQNRLESIRQQIDETQRSLAASASQSVKQFHLANVEGLREQRQRVEEQYQELMTRLRDAQATLARLKQLAAAEEDLEKNIADIKAAELETRLLYGGAQPVFLRRPAAKPRKPSMPRWSVMVPLGVFLGLAIGFGLAFLLEFIDTSVKSPRDITRRVDLPVLGMIPHLDDIEDEIADLRLAFLTNPNSLIGESFRQVRTCLLFSGPPAGRRSLLVTSPMPEDGRSTVALNLAGAMAHAGKNVLVVDTNFRQPVIRKLFPEASKVGLSDALTQQANWRDHISQVEQGLYVLSSGVLPPNPAELLGSEQMRRIVGEMVDQFDQVLFDGAPCLVVSDASVLSSVVDGTVLVVRAGSNTYGIVERTRDMLMHVGAHILGVVLNGVRVTAGGYYRRSYETFYEYHEQERLPASDGKDTPELAGAAKSDE